MATITNVTGAPMGSVADTADAVGGIEAEYFLEGTAAAYALSGGGSDYPTDGRWRAERTDQEAAFRTRMLVVRPRDGAAFNGTVVVLWNNVSAGESFLQSDRVARLLHDGFAVAGVSAQYVGVEGRDGTPALPDRRSRALRRPPAPR